jgi:hypothetical protein
MKAVHILGHLLLGLIFVAGFGAAVMLLWNWLMPPILGCTVVSFWQALGLLVLMRILFGGLGRGLWFGKAHHHHHHNSIREKWMNMTEDERKEFVKKHRFGHHGLGRDFFMEDKSEKTE